MPMKQAITLCVVRGRPQPERLEMLYTYLRRRYAFTTALETHVCAARTISGWCTTQASRCAAPAHAHETHLDTWTYGCGMSFLRRLHRESTVVGDQESPTICLQAARNMQRELADQDREQIELAGVFADEGAARYARFCKPVLDAAIRLQVRAKRQVHPLAPDK